MSVHAHHEAADSVMEWAHEHADELRPPMVQMQGRDAWPARRCSPEMACWAPEDQTESADKAVAAFVLKLVAAICAFAFLLWASHA